MMRPLRAVFLLAVPTSMIPLPACVHAQADVKLAGPDRNSAALPSSAPAGMLGVWDVVRVMVDKKDQPHWLYRPADPRLTGREVVLDKDRLRINDGSSSCEKPRWAVRRTTWGALLGESFARPPAAELSSRSAPADFGLRVAASERVTSFRVTCKPDGRGVAPSPWSDTWFVLGGHHELFMRIGTSALISMERRRASAEPRASFSCSRASTETERAICSSVALAALDRSMHDAFRETETRHPDERTRLRDEQAEWLTSRDRCGRETACLERSMLERIEALVQGW